MILDTQIPFEFKIYSIPVSCESNFIENIIDTDKFKRMQGKRFYSEKTLNELTVLMQTTFSNLNPSEQGA
jgi:hypothetical protein